MPNGRRSPNVGRDLREAVFSRGQGVPVRFPRKVLQLSNINWKDDEYSFRCWKKYRRHQYRED